MTLPKWFKVAQVGLFIILIDMGLLALASPVTGWVAVLWLVVLNVGSFVLGYGWALSNGEGTAQRVEEGMGR